MYRLIDLFSGCGGMTLGFVDRRYCDGFKSIFAIDNERAAVDSYESNFGKHALCSDIEKWLSYCSDIPKADIVIGGPPCQGYSLLNKNRIGDSRRALWMPYMDVVEQCGAKVFLIENVPGLLKSEEFNLLSLRAKNIGFNLVAGLLNAANYGAPQTRIRTVIFGWKRELADSVEFPPKINHSQYGENNLPRWKTVRDAIGDLPKPVGTEIRNEQPPLNLHFGRNPTPKSLARYKTIPPGGNRFDLQRNAPELTPDCWKRKTNGGTDLFGRLWWDRPSVTIRTEFFKPEKGRYLHPDQDRPITHREAARLMGFPDDFVFNGTKTEIARQIGNAVCPDFAGSLARYTKKYLDLWLSMPNIVADIT